MRAYLLMAFHYLERSCAALLLATVAFAQVEQAAALDNPGMAPVLQDVIMDSAHVVVWGNARAIRNAPIRDQLRDMVKKRGDSKAIEQNAAWRKFSEQLGLSDDSVHEFVLAANLKQVTFSERPKLDSLNAVFGATLDRPLSLEQIKTSIEAAAAEKDEPANNTRASMFAFEDRKLLKVTGQDGATKHEFWVLSSQPERAVYMGTPVGMRALIGRLPETPSGTDRREEATGAGPDNGFDLALRFVPFPAFRSQLSRQQQKTNRGGGNALMQQALSALADMEAATLGAAIDENLALKLQMALASDADAQTFKMFADTFLISMIKMGLAGAAASPPPMLERFSVDRDGNGVVLGVTMTPEDVELLKRGAEQQRNRGGQAPAVPPGATPRSPEDGGNEPPPPPPPVPPRNP